MMLLVSNKYIDLIEASNKPKKEVHKKFIPYSIFNQLPDMVTFISVTMLEVKAKILAYCNIIL